MSVVEAIPPRLVEEFCRERMLLGVFAGESRDDDMTMDLVTDAGAFSRARRARRVLRGCRWRPRVLPAFVRSFVRSFVGGGVATRVRATRFVCEGQLGRSCRFAVATVTLEGNLRFSSPAHPEHCPPNCLQLEIPI
jgi:hypothetical protein